MQIDPAYIILYKKPQAVIISVKLHAAASGSRAGFGHMGVIYGAHIMGGQGQYGSRPDLEAET